MTPEFDLHDLDGDGLSDLVQLVDGSLLATYRVDEGWGEEIEIATDVRDYLIVEHDEAELRDIDIIQANSFYRATQESYGEFVAGDPVVTGQTKIEDINEDGITDLTFVETDALAASLQSVVWFGSSAGFTEQETVFAVQPETQWLGTTMWWTSNTCLLYTSDAADE